MKCVLLFLLLVSIVNGKRIVYDWDLIYKNINPDGLHERRAITINNEWPPTPVTAHVNDTLVIHVKNKLNEPTTIHAHGINQDNGTNHMDGAAMVTQCGIAANHNFTYEFPVKQAGTFWFHSHYKVQYMDGLRVPLIVYDSNEALHYDEDETITVSDWYHEDSYTNLEQYMNHKNIEGVEPVPQSGLINDHVNTTLSFKPNKIYRLRLINMSGIAVFQVYIDHHDMEVIEVDGVLTKRSPAKMVYLASGQRISVLVKTKPNTDLNYYFHANMAPVMFDEIPDDLNLKIEAPIYYDKKSNHFASKQDPVHGTYDDAYIFPLVELEPLVPDKQINMTIDFMENTDGLNHGIINDIPYLPPLVPSLHTLLTIEKEYINRSIVYGPQSNAFINELDEVVEIVLNNLDDGPHPFHLHGHVFQVIARGKGIYSPDTEISIPKNPTMRDTIGVPGNGYVIIRFRANNPGVWFFHCHVDWHLPAGLAATFITAPELARDVFSPLSPELYDLCVSTGHPPTGNAAGKPGLDLEGAPDGIRPIHRSFILGCVIATLVGFSTIVWHVWVDPGQDDESDNEEEEEEDVKPLLKQEE